jgi:hypothetical protein
MVSASKSNPIGERRPRADAVRGARRHDSIPHALRSPCHDLVPFIARKTKPQQRPAYRPQPEVLEGRRLLTATTAKVLAETLWSVNVYDVGGGNYDNLDWLM